ncbi:PREDICTED: RNA-binding protein NOB1 isoform X3 [Nicotiana attenuata]|uniref:RNA-binding protein NOB1 isoform X3 n=1 Tax=Nicotiana attenuata TaxID=49451 RepID=UPI0009047E6D|nr:PREDICTED: RNA-binding protein NOB1 isoform X3 [Nicotiana attenuata]
MSSTTMDTQSPPPPPCWSNILKQPPPPPQPKTPSTFTAAVPTAAAAAGTGVLVGSCKSTKGIAVAIVDANTIIQGGDKLNHSADRFVSVPEVLSEIRDPNSRHSLNFLPFTVDTMEPSPDSLKKVISFARATGDLQTLSDVDLKLIALTYTLEAQFHGTHHLRDCPPPIHMVNVKRLPEKELPGWGSNVPNQEEWDAIEHAMDAGANTNSRILPLKDLSLNVIPLDQQSRDGSTLNGGDSHSEDQMDAEGGFGKPRKYPPQKKEVKIEGKKMVADGIDASQGQYDEDGDDWRPAVSRSTHRRFLRRKARREMSETSSKMDDIQDSAENAVNENLDNCQYDDMAMSHIPEENHEANGEGNAITEVRDGEENLSTILSQMRLEEDSAKDLQDDADVNIPLEGSESNDAKQDSKESEEDEGENFDSADGGAEDAEMASQMDESIETSFVDDDSSEQSWMLKSLSESSVACVTGDFAMQNVILQMGLRLVAPGGMQIRELHRWVLKCHACYKVTTDVGRIFCPNCGNGGTLRKVAVTVGENGIVLAARRPRISLRGTKFSLPLPQGGRDAVTKNPILREDQLPQKFLYPKTKKKNKQGDEIFTPDTLFLHHTSKKAPLQPPVRKALAVFSGKRNPNDNHYSRAKSSLLKGIAK